MIKQRRSVTIERCLLDDSLESPLIELPLTEPSSFPIRQDLRNDANTIKELEKMKQRPVSPEEGRAMAGRCTRSVRIVYESVVNLLRICCESPANQGVVRFVLIDSFVHFICPPCYPDHLANLFSLPLSPSPLPFKRSQ